MIILTNCNFANTNKPLTSATAFNFAGDTLALQISGSKGVYRLEGRNAISGDWAPLAGINLSNLTVVPGTFTQPGLYEVGIVGVREMRVVVDSVEGHVDITGQIISTQEA